MTNYIFATVSSTQ